MLVPNRSRLRFLAYVVLAIAGVFGFWRQEQIANETEEEARARALAICEATNDVRQVILQLVNQTGGGTTQVKLEDIEDPTLRELVKESRESNAEFRKEAGALLVKQQCRNLP